MARKVNIVFNPPIDPYEARVWNHNIGDEKVSSIEITFVSEAAEAKKRSEAARKANATRKAGKAI